MRQRDTISSMDSFKFSSASFCSSSFSSSVSTVLFTDAAHSSSSSSSSASINITAVHHRQRQPTMMASSSPPASLCPHIPDFLPFVAAAPKKNNNHHHRVLSSPRAYSPPAPLNGRSTKLQLFSAILFLLICTFFCCFLTSVAAADYDDEAGGRRCATCDPQTFEDYKQLRQEQILKDLLNKLDLPAKPNVTVDYNNLRYIAPRNARIQALIDKSRMERQPNNQRRVRKSIQQWRRRNSGESDGREESGDNEYYPSLYETQQEEPVETSYILAQRAPDWLAEQGLQAALFNFAPILRKKFVTMARLNVFLRRPEQFVPFGTSALVRTQLNVYQRFSNGTLGPKLIEKDMALNMDKSTVYEQVELPLDAMLVQEWIENGMQFEQQTVVEEQEEEQEAADHDIGTEQPQPRSGSSSTVALYAEAMHQGENLVQYVGDDANAATEETSSSVANDAARVVMFLELEMINLKSGGRSRRNPHHVCTSAADKCCLHDLVIDFEKIGWDFVIAPKRYNAYICSGHCNNMTTSLYSRGDAAKKANFDHFHCCHPKEYTGITILFVQQESDIVMMREVPNMVAKDCGCT